MDIAAIETFHVARPLLHPWRTAYGEDAEIHSVLVRVISDGYAGWGEACPFYAPTYSPETASSAFFLISELFAPALVGQEIESARDLLDQLHPFKGNPFAKAGVESGWWMLQAAMSEQPLHLLLGGETRHVRAGADFGVQDTYEILIAKIQAAVDRGFPRVKLKVQRGWDLEMLQAVRSTFPRLTLQIDCNGAYSLDDLALFKALDELDLAMIEQPLFHTDLFDHAELQRQIRTPICLDESVKSARDLELALSLGSCRVLNVKYGRVGGVSVAIKLHNMARNAGIPCWVGGMLESAIGVGISIELATLPNFAHPNDLFESQRFYPESLTDPAPRLNCECTFSPSTVPGTPYRPVMDRVIDATIDRTIVEA